MIQKEKKPQIANLKVEQQCKKWIVEGKNWLKICVLRFYTYANQYKSSLEYTRPDGVLGTLIKHWYTMKTVYKQVCH